MMTGPETTSGSGKTNPEGKPGSSGTSGQPRTRLGQSVNSRAVTGGKVLFIVYYLPPMGSSGVQRPLKMIKYLPQFGWDPVVLAPEPGAYHTFDQTLAEELAQTGAEIQRVAAKTPFHTAGGGARDLSWMPESGRRVIRSLGSWFYLPDNKRGWIKPAIEKGRELLQRGDISLIFSTAPPYSNHMIAATLGRESGLPVVMDFRDDWLGSHLLNFPTAAHRDKMKKLEADTLAGASLVTAINRSMLASLQSRLPGNIRAVVLPQGFDPADFPEPVREACQPARQSNTTTESGRRPYCITYNGIFYGAQKPDVFFYAVKALIDEGKIIESDIRLVFQGGLEGSALKLADELGLTDIIENKGYLPHRESVKSLVESDLLWFTVGRQKNQEQVTTGKLFEYIGTGKPVLGLVPEGEAADVLRKYGVGYRADPDNVAEVQQTLWEIISMFREGLLPEPDMVYTNTYDRIKIAGKLAALFDELKSHKTG